MLRRVYDENYLEKYPTYRNVKICSDWLVFSNFKSWMENQDWEGKELDKDILGSKLYSPECCAFINPATNKFLTNCSKIKLSFLEKRNVYRVKIGSIDGGETFIGDFVSRKDAEDAWIHGKKSEALKYAATEKDVRIVEKLKNLGFKGVFNYD